MHQRMLKLLTVDEKDEMVIYKESYFNFIETMNNNGTTYTGHYLFELER